MRCPYCTNEDTRVVETRSAGSDIRRRRQCPACSKRFTTYERIERVPLRVIKKDGSRELFDRDKLRRGLLRACEKRPVSDEQIEDALSAVEEGLLGRGVSEISSSVIGDLLMERLRALDEVAYIRFASVYKHFTDVESFANEIRQLKRNS